MQANAIVVVKPGRQRPLVARHPWVHAGSLVPSDPPPPDGAVVDVVSHSGAWIARGVYNGASQIRVRLFTWNPEEIFDEGLVVGRIDAAIRRREPLGLGGQDQAERLVFSEADGLSGLVVDRYGKYLVVQLTSAAMARMSEPIVAHLGERLQPAGVLVRTDARAAKAEGIEPRDAVALGQPPEGPLEIVEHGVRLAVDLRESQKTGLYLDQRDNRLAAARYLAGRRVLDVCCYFGGFALAAAKAGAASVLAVDSSKRALEAAAANVRLNGMEDRIELREGEMFDVIDQLREAGEAFDAVILDPPRFASSRAGLDAALRAYHRINRAAVELLPPGGILVTCSCSGRVTRTDFLNTLVDVGRRARRDLVIMESRGAAPDHPVRLACPETDYLKCVIAEVV